jgi:superfamily II DNA or RNA helicase
VFTETVRAANHAINRLDPLVSIDVITGSTARAQRRDILDDLRVSKLDAVAAPRVLDEGIDVPDANLGIVMSASRTRRQMIQRMGRILRRKRPGIAARFVIMFAQDTLEDPANHVERDGFLDEIERISDASGIFESAQFEQLGAFLAEPGPKLVPEPARVDRAQVDEAFRLHVAPPPRGRRDRAPYLELALSNLPAVAKPRVEPKRLSTGREPLEIARIGSAWRISCTGCGEASPLVEFRWQVLDQTVACRC